MNSVADIRRDFGWRYKDGQPFVNDKLGGEVIEIINACFQADKPVIFGTLNHDYLDRERRWYLSQSRNVKSFPGGAPTIWNEVADKDGYINSNYGWCCFSQANGMQYYKVRDELIKNPSSRRAVMIYTRPSMWEDYNENGRSDFICTNTVQYVIRGPFLYAMVYMRSQDAVFGYKNDKHWQDYVMNELLNDLREVYPDLMKGLMYWNVGSLHVYERHFYMVDYFNKTGIHDVKRKTYDEEAGG